MEKKLEELSRFDKGESLKKYFRELWCRKFNCIGQKKNRINIEDFCFKMISKDNLDDRNKAKKAKRETLDETLFVSFCSKSERGLPLSRPIIKKKNVDINDIESWQKVGQTMVEVTVQSLTRKSLRLIHLKMLKNVKRQMRVTMNYRQL